MSPGDRPTFAYLLCVEAGPLEEQALLLARSIRRWAGRYADYPVHAFRPRVGPPLAAETYAGLAALGVHLHEEVLNREHHDYVHTNTIYTLVWAERELDVEVIVWCDSDKVFLSEPASFELPTGIDAGVTPAYRTRGGTKSTGPGHEHDPFWKRMYELAGVTEEPFITALEEGTRMRSYWNGGLVALRRSAGLGRQWLSLFDLLLKVGHIPKAGVVNLDQLALAATLARRPAAAQQLAFTYNYNIARRARLPEPMRSVELAQLVSVHYHHWFNREHFLEDVQPLLSRDSERYLWLREFLPLQPTHDKPLPTPPGAR